MASQPALQGRDGPRWAHRDVITDPPEHDLIPWFNPQLCAEPLGDYNLALRAHRASHTSQYDHGRELAGARSWVMELKANDIFPQRENNLCKLDVASGLIAAYTDVHAAADVAAVFDVCRRIIAVPVESAE